MSQTAEKDKEIQRLRTEVAEHKPTTDNTAQIEELKRVSNSIYNLTNYVDDLNI